MKTAEKLEFTAEFGSKERGALVNTSTTFSDINGKFTKSLLRGDRLSSACRRKVYEAMGAGRDTYGEIKDAVFYSTFEVLRRS